MTMCESATRDPGCPVKITYTADPVEIIGCAFRGGLPGGEVGPIDGMDGNSAHIWRDNVAHTTWAFSTFRPRNSGVRPTISPVRNTASRANTSR